MCSPDIFLGLIAVLFPPIAVWIKAGICSADSVINLALCCLGYIPGLLHAWYIIAKNPDAADGYEAVDDSEQGQRHHTHHVAYHYAPHGGAHHQQGAGSGRNYGTTGSNITSSDAPTAPSMQYPQQGGQIEYEQWRLQQQNQHQQWQKDYQQHQQQVPATLDDAADGPSNPGVPPTYAEAVRGDNKVQS
ncbi:hypothetical protein L228DRAFT_105949 [Xylona heveae TC161]|uniref:Uncharacterized protein n=1 Tax=Xylona heveae (strain CBS 132557 / TC161) TaxID=1328760 RepID=A0A161TBV0_XYLHT|nr:hypothetical protein L228DRAFT_105949 [Xylona heveae TC161]KZF23187.1 hypothetical protein L228DRAFT_105949 [Xylona heveae TC161]